MKRFGNFILKLIIALVIVFVLYFVINNVRNYIIINTWKNASIVLGEELNNFYYQNKCNLDDKEVYSCSIYYKDGITREELLEFSEYMVIEYDENENILYSKGEREDIDFTRLNYDKDLVLNMFKFSDEVYKDLLRKNCLKWINKIDNMYVITDGDRNIFINSENNLCEYVTEESWIYKLKLDIVLDDNFSYNDSL